MILPKLVGFAMLGSSVLEDLIIALPAKLAPSAELARRFVKLAKVESTAMLLLQSVWIVLQDLTVKVVLQVAKVVPLVHAVLQAPKSVKSVLQGDL